MGTGYTRNDTANNIADGNVINAADFDGEYDAIEAAFNSATGHTHDGTAAEGGAITVLGPSQEFVASGSSVNPSTTLGLDLGTSSLQFNDLYLGGTAYITGLGGNLLVDTNNALQFRDAAINIASTIDGQMDIAADDAVKVTTPNLIATDDVSLQSDGAILNFGADDDVTVTHVHNSGLATQAANGFALNFQTGDISVDTGNTIGKVTFSAPLEDSGSVAVQAGAEIEAQAESTFSATNNATKLLFKTNNSGAATERMRIESDGDVVFTGSSANMFWNNTDNALDFGDVVSARFGDDNDLQIIHSGLNGRIRNTTGELTLQSDGITLQSDTGTEKFIEMDLDGSVALYYDNVKTFETATDGVDVTGNLDVGNINIDTNTIASTDLNGDINLSPDGTGTVVINTDLDVDNINIDGNTITSTDTNGDINLSPNGTGTVVINTDLDVDNLNINGNTINATNANGPVNITTTTNGNINLTPNGTGVVNISYNGANVFSTTATGASIVGELSATTINAPLATTATAVTQPQGDNSTKIATTAYVDAAATGTGTSSEDSALALAIALG